MNRKCPHCGEIIPEEAKYCLKCMNYTIELSNPKTIDSINKSNKSRIIIICTSVLIVIAAVAATIIANSSQKLETTTMLSSVSSTAPEPSSSASIKSETTLDKTKSNETYTTEATTSTTTTTATTTTTTEATTITTTSAKKVTSTPKPIIRNETLISYPAKIKKTSYRIPYKVKSISSNAFNNKHLKSLYFSERENLDCDWKSLFGGLPNLQTIYIYPGTSVDIEGKQYFQGKIVYM